MLSRIVFLIHFFSDGDAHGLMIHPERRVDTGLKTRSSMYSFVLGRLRRIG